MPGTSQLHPTLDYWSWQEIAACRDREDLFYNTDAESKGARRRKEVQAKEVCLTCPALDKCREFALSTGQLYGVWGGLTEMERHRIAGRHRSG